MDALQLEKVYELFSAGIGAHSDMSLKFVSTEENRVVLEMPFQEKHATAHENGSLNLALWQPHWRSETLRIGVGQRD